MPVNKFGRIILSSLLIFCFVFGAALPAAWAKEPATPQISLKEAVLKAWDNSEGIRAAGYNIDKTKEQRDKMSDYVKFIPAAGSGLSPELDMLWTNFVKADIGYQTAKKDLEQKKDNVMVDVFTKYYTIIYCQENLNKAEITLERDEKALQMARAQLQAGTATEAVVKGAEAKAEAGRKAVETAKSELEKAYISFNRLVGLWPEDRPILTDALNMTPLEIDNLDTEAARAVTASKDVWKLKQLVQLEQLDVDYPWGVGAAGASWKYYKIEKPDVDIAEENVAAAKNTIKETVRTLYHDITADEEQYNALLAAKKAAEEQLRVTKALYDGGMITLDKLKEAESACAEIQNNLSGLAYKHAVQVANFNILTNRPVVQGVSDDELAAERKEQQRKYKEQKKNKDQAAVEEEPAPTVAVLKVGDKKYTVDGKEYQMDVAPFAIEGRAFLPVRYAAQVVGIPDECIHWDGKTQKVILINGDDTITMTVGSKAMLVNTSVVEMDVAPEVRGGRVFLPIRYLGEVLGADINYNLIRREITVTC